MEDKPKIMIIGCGASTGIEAASIINKIMMQDPHNIDIVIVDSLDAPEVIPYIQRPISNMEFPLIELDFEPNNRRTRRKNRKKKKR